LHAAAMRGHAAICVVLLQAGAGVDIQTDPQGYAPLHSAAYAGHLAAIRVLLAHGADRNLRNYRGERTADTARRQGQPAAVEQLETDGALPDAEPGPLRRDYFRFFRRLFGKQVE